ncbi:hypothetical protein SESBI_40662 [Sesbania bispinosa]|nr:hypothetical protein SESBI_40662 [Sesbania bispinosa]
MKSGGGQVGSGHLRVAVATFREWEGNRHSEVNKKSNRTTLGMSWGWGQTRINHECEIIKWCDSRCFSVFEGGGVVTAVSRMPRCLISWTHTFPP